MLRRLGRTAVALGLASFLNDASSEMIFPLLPLFLVGTLGAGPAFLGVVEGVAETTASFVKLAGGWLSDRLRRRKSLVVWGYGIAAASRPLMAAAQAPWHVLGVRFADRVGKGARTAPRDALLAESVSAGVRGRAFGVHRAADHAGAIIGPLLAAGILLLWPGRLRLVFLLALVPALLATLVVALRVRERAPADTPETAPAAEPLPRGRFIGYLVVVVVFTLGNASDAFLLLRAEQLGVATVAVPLLWSTLHVSKMVWNLVGGWAADRFGAGVTLVAGWLVYAATYTGFALATTAAHAWALFILYGLFYGLTEPTGKTLVAGLSSSATRARAFGAYHFATGLAALPASLVFGLVWQVWGAAAAFLLGAALASTAAVALPPALRR